MTYARLIALFALALAMRNTAARAQDQPWVRPYHGSDRGDIDATTIDGKVLCGYQGWFNTPGDGTRFGFSHWGNGLENGSGRFTVDMWPDLMEYDPADLAAVPGVLMPDGSVARLYTRVSFWPDFAALQMDAGIWDRRGFSEPV